MGTCKSCKKKKVTIYKGLCYRCQLELEPYEAPKIKEIIKDILKS